MNDYIKRYSIIDLKELKQDWKDNNWKIRLLFVIIPLLPAIFIFIFKNSAYYIFTPRSDYPFSTFGSLIFWVSIIISLFGFLFLIKPIITRIIIPILIWIIQVFVFITTTVQYTLASLSQALDNLE